MRPATCSTGSGCAGRAAASNAREQLRTAYDMMDAMGMAAFAERARRELAATARTARKRTAPAARTAGASETLTAQEAQVALRARDGLSNPEIGARLFISARTVQYHLSKVFTKLGISSAQTALPGPAWPTRTPPGQASPPVGIAATAPPGRPASATYRPRLSLSCRPPPRVAPEYGFLPMWRRVP